MSATTMTTKGQVTIPVQIRRKFGIEPGDRVIVEEREGTICLRPAIDNVEDSFGILSAEQTLSLDELNDVDKQAAIK